MPNLDSASQDKLASLQQARRACLVPQAPATTPSLARRPQCGENYATELPEIGYPSLAHTHRPPGVLSIPILSYPILSYPILSYPILSYRRRHPIRCPAPPARATTLAPIPNIPPPGWPEPQHLFQIAKPSSRAHTPSQHLCARPSRKLSQSSTQAGDMPHLDTASQEKLAPLNQARRACLVLL